MLRKCSVLWLLGGLLGAVSIARAGLLPGLGGVKGTIFGESGRIVQVYLYHAQMHVGYAVFAVNGTYRAVDMFPGHYDITLRQAGLELPPFSVDVRAGESVEANLSPREVPILPTYTGGYAVPDAKVEAYDAIYSSGHGRGIVERTCVVCHGVNFLPNHHLDRDGWKGAVHYMTQQPAFATLGLTQGPSIMDPARIGAKDLPILIDYLATNFGPYSTARAVRQELEPELDPAALRKAMFIEYRFPNTPTMPRRWTQELHFDTNGNVFVTDRGRPPAILRLDPRTGASKDYLTPNPKSSPHGITVDADDTVWWAGSPNFLAHLDPATGLTDQYPASEMGLHGHTPVFDSKGDLWFSMLPSNKIGHWERATDRITYFETPSPRGRPYGLVVDHEDKVWYVEFFTDHVVRFDPKTKTFTRFLIKSAPASLRRLGVDSKNVIWYGIYGTVGKSGKLGRLDPKTGAVIERDLPIEYSNPYDAWPDDDDNIWSSCDNYLVKLARSTDRFTVFPLPERTDAPKLMIISEGAIWFTPRSAGAAGYGGGASVLYPDMDAITTLAARYSRSSSADHIAQYHGMPQKVTGSIKVSNDGPQNPRLLKMNQRVIGLSPGESGPSGNEGKIAD